MCNQFPSITPSSAHRLLDRVDDARIHPGVIGSVFLS